MRLKNVVLVFCVLCTVAAVWMTWEVVFSDEAGDLGVAETAGLQAKEERTPANADLEGVYDSDEEMAARAADREAVKPAIVAEGDEQDDDNVIPGTVLYHVVTASSFEQVNSVNIRFMNDERFASHYSSATGKVHLSPGVYTCAVIVNGYDPAIVENVRARSGETTDLGDIALYSGTAVIEGFVNVRHLEFSEPVIVELFGSGRSRCSLCGANGTGVGTEIPKGRCTCGFSRENTTRVLKYDHRFTFPSLAGGVYFVHTRGFSSKHCDVRRVELDCGGYACIAVDLAPELSVPFLLLSESGMPFFSEMEAEQQIDESFEVELEAIRFHFRHDGRLIAEATAIPSFAGSYWEEIFEEEDATIDAPIDLDWRRDRDRPRPMDRARKPGDVFVPVFAKPGLEAVTLQVRMHGNSSMTLLPLPALMLEAEVTACGSTSGVFALDLNRWTGGSVPVTLKQR